MSRTEESARLLRQSGVSVVAVGVKVSTVLIIAANPFKTYQRMNYDWRFNSVILPNFQRVTLKVAF